MSKLYERAIGNIEEVVPPTEQDAMTAQAKMNWLQSTVTQEMFKNLHKQSESLLSSAMDLAVANHSTDNNKQIVHKLIEASVLRKVIKDYAK
jgi:hypothetical protein